MSKRLQLVVAYDGVPFAGWQSQKNGDAIQDRLESAFHAISGQTIRVHGAGRTDAGVHALAQCAHVDLPDNRFGTEKWLAALNSRLPPTIRVLRCRYVPATFHARFSAIGKVYRYRIWNDPILLPFENGRAWHIASPLNFHELEATAQEFCGEHDFAAFAANRGKPGESTVRLIHRVKIRRAGARCVIEIEGNGFLYKMVRLMVGALVRVGLGKASREEIALALTAPKKGCGLTKLVAPADGLFLVRVRY
jgi:tRNA pseudouridine38-40 synthase